MIVINSAKQKKLQLIGEEDRDQGFAMGKKLQQIFFSSSKADETPRNTIMEQDVSEIN